MTYLKKVIISILTLGMVLGVFACRNNAGGENPAPAPVAKKLDKIEIVTSTEIAVQKDATEFSTTGIIVKATFSDGSESIKADKFNEDGWSLNTDNFAPAVVTTGYEQEIVISYTYEGVMKSASLFARIYDPDAFQSIKVKDGTAPQEHATGSTLNPFGLVVQITLDDGSIVDVIDFNDDTKWIFEGFDSSAENDDLQVTVKYTSGGKTEAATFSMKIYDPDAWTDINIVQAPFKKEYDFVEDGSGTLDLTGLNIAITLKDGSIVNVNNVTDFVAPKWSITGFESNKDGEQTITVTYTTSSKTGSVTFTVTVIGNRYKGLTLVSGPTDVQYIIGEKFNPSGLEVTVNHLNSKYDFPFKPTNVSEFTGRWELFGYDSGSEKADLPIEVRYMSEDGTAILGKVSFTVDIYKIDGVTMTDPPEKDKYYFEGETVQYVKDLYLPTAVVNLNLVAEGKNSNDTYPITDPVFKGYGITATGDVNATGTEFEIQPGSPGRAQIKCRVDVNDTLWFEPTFSVTVVKKYDFHKTIAKADYSKLPPGISVHGNTIGGTPLAVADNELKFVTFGDYPQSIAQIVDPASGTILYGDSLHIYEMSEREKIVGGMKMYLGSDGDYYVKVLKAKKNTEGDDNRYDFAAGAERNVWNGNTCWFRVEPLWWRVLDTNYKNTGALLWSVKAIDRMPYFADNYSPDDGHDSSLPYDPTNEVYLTGGGKSERTINGNPVKWSNYRYSTLRAFLLGEYEPGDPQSNPGYDQIFTGKNDTKVLLEKFDGTNGFLQRAFAPEAVTTYLKKVPLDTDMNDYVFVLSGDELQISAAEYYFMAAGAIQQQRAKNPTHYTMARENKRWSIKDKANGTSMNHPGSNFWTRSESSSGVINVHGHGNFGGCGRGAYKDGAVVPAICVDSSKLPAF